MADKRNPGALAGATGAGKPSHAEAAGTCKVAESKAHAKRGGSYHVTPRMGEPFTIQAYGRDAWALERLIAADLKGCTPISDPAPRWSAYIFNLRALGLEIETITEKHGGEFSGWHARYILRADVLALETNMRAAAVAKLGGGD